MILPDVNLLVYAIDETSPFHTGARRWWETALSSSGTVGLCHPVVLGFVRLVTNRHVFSAPLLVGVALDNVQQWLDRPNVALLTPTDRHWPVLSELLRSSGAGARPDDGRAHRRVRDRARRDVVHERRRFRPVRGTAVEEPAEVTLRAAWTLEATEDHLRLTVPRSANDHGLA